MTSPPRAHAPGIPFLFWAALPVIVGGWLRLRGLGTLEPFVDEGANILTALHPGVRQAFEPLEQGRPWLTGLFAPAGWFAIEPLLVARVMSALAGLLTMGALGWILHQLGGRRAALAGLCLWAVLPVAVWHERLALQDPFVTAALAWALALALAANRPEARHRPVCLAGAGLLFGTAFLLKISALFAVSWLGIVYFGTQRHRRRPGFDRELGWLVAGALLPLLTLGSGLLQLGGKLGRYDALPSLDGNVATTAINRFKLWLGWYAGYGTWPLLLLGLLAMVLAAQSRHRLVWWCAAGWAASLVVGGFLFNNSYARYTLPDHVPLVLGLALAVGGVTTGRWRTVALGMGALAVAGWGHAALQISRKPASATVPPSEIVQYVTGPWSGRGLTEVRRFLTDYADRHQTRCVVLTHRFMRPGCYGLMLAELGDPRIGVVPFTIYEPEELVAARAGVQHAVRATARNAALFILYEGSLYPAHPWLDAAGSPARRVLEVPRGPGESFTLYQLTP